MNGARLVLFAAALLVWCVLNWIPDGEHLLVGVVVASIVTYVNGDLVFRRPRLLLQPRRWLLFTFQYLPVLIWEVVTANLDVAYRVLHPRRPIRPGIVKVDTSLDSDIAITLLANSITLTPGTMSVDIAGDGSALYVHWIDVRTTESREAARLLVERFEGILRRIFEEE